MARRLEHLQSNIADVERGAVRHRRERVLCLRRRAEIDGRAGSISKLEMAGDEVCMKVREEDVTDRQAMTIRLVLIFLHVASRIDDDRSFRRLVANQVGRMGKTVEVELFEDHSGS